MFGTCTDHPGATRLNLVGPSVGVPHGAVLTVPRTPVRIAPAGDGMSSQPTVLLSSNLAATRRHSWQEGTR